MKTRTLLLLAVASGLVILLAGSVKLFLIADEKAPPHLVIGETGTIGDMMVTVLSVDRAGAETYIGVRLIGVDDPDGATSWVLGVVGEQLRPLAPPTSVGPACEATSVDSETSCVLAFQTIDIGVLTYGRADETIRWDIPA